MSDTKVSVQFIKFGFGNFLWTKNSEKLNLFGICFTMVQLWLKMVLLGFIGKMLTQPHFLYLWLFRAIRQLTGLCIPQEPSGTAWQPLYFVTVFYNYVQWIGQRDHTTESSPNIYNFENYSYNLGEKLPATKAASKIPWTIFDWKENITPFMGAPKLCAVKGEAGE